MDVTIIDPKAIAHHERSGQDLPLWWYVEAPGIGHLFLIRLSEPEARSFVEAWYVNSSPKGELEDDAKLLIVQLVSKAIGKPISLYTAAPVRRVELLAEGIEKFRQLNVDCGNCSDPSEIFAAGLRHPSITG